MSPQLSDVLTTDVHIPSDIADTTRESMRAYRLFGALHQVLLGLVANMEAFIINRIIESIRTTFQNALERLHMTGILG